MKRRGKPLTLLLISLLLLYGANGCSPEDPPTPTQPTIRPPATGAKSVTLTADPQNIAADGRSSSYILAICTVGGQQAPNNLPVRFTTNKGDFSLDGINPISSQKPTKAYDMYTADGTAAIYLISEEQEGQATVYANFGNAASDSTVVGFVRSIGDAGSITLQLNPSTGNSPLTVKAEASVLSKTEEPLSGALVVFSITDKLAKIDNKQVHTDSNGSASTFIRNVLKDSTITARFGDLETKELVNIENEAEVGSVTLKLTPNTGIAPLVVVAEATVKSISDDLLKNETVEFSISIDSAKIDQKKVKTDSSGVASTVIRNITDDATVTAKAGRIKANEFVEIENEKDIGSLALKISPESGVAPLTVTAEVEVKSASDNPIPNVEVEFTITDSFATVERSTVKTDINGKASTVIRNISKDATITAKAGKFRVQELVEVDDEGDVGTLTLVLSPSSGSAPLTTKATATVKSINDKVLPNVKVGFSISDPAASIENKVVYSDSSGKAITFIHNISQDATVTAKAGNVVADALVEIDNDLDRSLTLVAIKSGTQMSEPVIINNQAKLLLRATVKSATTGGSPVPGVVVTFSSTPSGATFTRNNVKTNSNGEVETYAQNISQDSIIIAETTNTSDSLAVKINKPPVADFDLISGTPTAGEVNNLVFSAEASYDPDEASGDEISYKWTVTISASADVTITTSSTSDKVITVTVGTAGGNMPASGDVLTVVLTVTDDNDLSDTQVTTYTF